MGFSGILQYKDVNGQKYSEIISYDNGRTRYRIIKNPSRLTQIYYFTFDKNEIFVKLYPWDK